MDPIEADRPLRLTWRSVALYVLLIGAGIGRILFVPAFGRDLAAPRHARRGEAFGKGDPKLKFDVLVHVLLALAVVIVDRARCWAPVRQAQSAAGDRRGAGRHPAGPVAARPHGPVGVRVPAADQRRAFPVGARPGRRDSVHVPRRAGAGHRACCASAPTPRWPCRTPASCCRSCSAAALALLLYPRLSTSDVPFTVLRAVLRRRHVRDRVPGAGAHPDRPRHARHRAWA